MAALGAWSRFADAELNFTVPGDWRPIVKVAFDTANLAGVLLYYWATYYLV